MPDCPKLSMSTDGQGLARPATTLPCAFHTDFRLLDQSGGTLVCRAHAKAIATRCPHLNPPLERDIRAFIARHNQHSKPYKWTKSADEILSAVKRFCQKAQNTLCGEL
jgi:hypothetical protein